MNDPYLPPATELREDLPPRRYGHVAGGAALAYLAATAFLLAMQSDLGRWTYQLSAIGVAVGAAVLFLQFRQLSWRQVLVIAPPVGLVMLVAISIAVDYVF